MSSVKTDLYILAGAAQDATEPPRRPAAIHWRDGEIIAVGSPDQLAPPAGAKVIERPNHLVLPPLVNAHAHLDLTSVGPQPCGRDFIEWIDFIRSARPTDPESLAASVRLGIEMSITGGTAIIGDIGGIGSTVPLEVLRADSRLRGISFVEFFGLGSRQRQAVEAMEALCEKYPVDRKERIQAGLQPHAPYSAGPEVYAAADRLSAARGMPASTHLAETQAEIEFARSATGPFADFLRKIGKWDGGITPLGEHPVEMLAMVSGERSRWLAVHMNYIDVRRLYRVELVGTAIVHCPRATAYFGHDVRRYRNVMQWHLFALGTDSIVNLDRTDRISILDEMSLLHRRDRVGPAALLKCATVDGAKSLGSDAELVTLQPGPCAGLIAVEFDPRDPKDALAQVLSDPGPIEWLARA